MAKLAQITWNFPQTEKLKHLQIFDPIFLCKQINTKVWQIIWFVNTQGYLQKCWMIILTVPTRANNVWPTWPDFVYVQHCCPCGADVWQLSHMFDVRSNCNHTLMFAKQCMLVWGVMFDKCHTKSLGSFPKKQLL